MIDVHTVPYPEWGVRPILFYAGNLPVPSYSFFILLGLIIGIIVFWLEAKKNKSNNEKTFYIFLAGILGGIIGAKIPMIFIYWNDIISTFPDLTILLSAKSITGGFIGGTIAVLYLKHRLKIKEKKGNIFAPAIAIGVAIGRMGCFLRGCCYGVETSLPWGVDFGDGIMRHPTQLYESIFMLGMFVYLMIRKNIKPLPKPGSLFKILMISYFTFRFFIEFIRVEPVAFLGLSYFQILSVIAVLWFIFKKD